MNFLLDTHILSWWLSTPEKLESLAVEQIKNMDNNIFVSSASLWEMSIKKGLGRLDFP